ncbi:MAG TPA: zinc ribbon domain-containing protein [Ktedonobacterales bacterium]
MYTGAAGVTERLTAGDGKVMQMSHMGPMHLACPRCGTRSAPGTRYCPSCGEPVAPELVAELNTLYGSVQTLDAIIAAGDGRYTVQALRDEYAARYLAQRQGAPAAQAPQVAPAPAPSSTPHGSAALSSVPLVPAGTAAMRATPRPLVAQAAPAAPAAPRPVFSWRAFLAEQAIAIMAYLGGFLLLVATLSFEVGAWQVLGDKLKLAVVLTVYVVFGALGLALRRSVHLRTVGRAYLGVFALMTPLVALAVYRFALQAVGFPVAGMVCAAAAYAAAIYLLLAWRTAFVTYAYLGATALVVAALAIPSWADASWLWWLASLAGAALLLVAMTLLPGVRRTPLHAPALIVAAAASALAVIGSVGLGLRLWSGYYAYYGADQPVAAYAGVAVALVPLAVCWSPALRRLPRPIPPVVLDAVEWLIAATVVQATIAGGAWRGASPSATADALALVAMAQLVAVAALHRWQPNRRLLRHGIEALALAVATIAVVLAWPGPAQNPSLTLALSAACVIATVVAVVEAQPWLLLLAGLYLSVDYYTFLGGVLPPGGGPDPTQTQLVAALASGGLALLLWAVAFSLRAPGSGSARPLAALRRFGTPLYVVALGNALYALQFLTLQTRGFETAVPAAFALLALIAGMRERQPALAGPVVAVFGMLAALPGTLGVRNGWLIALTMLIATLVAIAARRALGRAWALAFYVISLWATLLAAVMLQLPAVSTAHAELLEVSFAAWALLAVAALSAFVALWERRPEAMIVPALEGLGAVLSLHHHAPALALTLAAAAAGAGLRLWRGRWWNLALYGAAALASVWTVATLADLEGNAAKWQVVALLIFAAAAYALAALDRFPYATPAAFLYALAATRLLPGPENLVPTLAITFGCVALGIAARLRFGRAWALAFYAVAAQASLFAVARVPHANPGATEALLLIFAAAAYAVAVVEAAPLAGFAPAAYGIWAALVQPDAHALLPLALVLAAIGFAVGRLVGPRWSWPAYLMAAASAGATAVLGQAQPSFEPLALLALAVAAYLIAAAESRADVLPLALALGVFALSSGIGALHWAEWQGVLAFAGLSWIYMGLGELWRRLPWLRDRGFLWWGIADAAVGLSLASAPEPWRTTRGAGERIQRWGALLAGAGTTLVALIAPSAFAPRSAPTEAAVVALLALAGLLAMQSRASGWHLALYAAGMLAALAVSWQARWLGADNMQAYILTPGSLLIVEGALAPSDRRLGRYAAPLGQLLSFAGAAVLLLPTLGQSFATDPNWLYALILAVEALALALAGVGTRSRLLVLAGSVFVGVAALRGAALAVDSGVPIPLVIGGLALLLMGGATWLSLRVRQSGQQASP